MNEWIYTMHSLTSQSIGVQWSWTFICDSCKTCCWLHVFHVDFNEIFIFLCPACKLWLDHLVCPSSEDQTLANKFRKLDIWNNRIYRSCSDHNLQKSRVQGARLLEHMCCGRKVGSFLPLFWNSLNRYMSPMKYMSLKYRITLCSL